MTIGYITASDPLDKRSWSGVNYNILKSLEKRGLTVIPLGPTKYSRTQMRFLTLITKLNSIIFFGKRYNSIHNFSKAFFAARYFSKKVKQYQLDFIFAPAAANEIAFLKTSVPIINLGDTSFNQVRDYYKIFSDLSSFSIMESNSIESRAIHKSVAIIYPSQWAATYVIDYYKADKKKVHVIGFGPNIEVPQQIIYNKEYNGTISFLFLGVDWPRKGGEIALETIEKLNGRGYKVKLIVCGCIPPTENELMEVIPFLDKNKPEDNKRLQALLTECHFLFLPTRAEALGIVFCEASAYGLPIITTNTGGVTAAVENGVNGYALAMDAHSDQYVDIIQDLLNSPEKIVAMSKSARQKYETELNWDIFGEKFEHLVESLK